jgi:hypothetical protein
VNEVLTYLYRSLPSEAELQGMGKACSRPADRRKSISSVGTPYAMLEIDDHRISHCEYRRLDFDMQECRPHSIY